MLVNFVVVEATSAYKVNLRRPTLNRTRVIVSTYSLIVKFSTSYGVERMRGDQATTQCCYVNSLWRNAISEFLNMEELDLRDNADQVTLVKKLEPMVLNDEYPN